MQTPAGLYDSRVSSTVLEVRRGLTLTHAASLVVGITIGTGVFLKSAAMAQAVGTPALVLGAWVAAGVVAMLGALCFAELGALLPQAGGEYVYLRTAYGELPGFLFACNAFIFGGAAVAAYGAAVAIFVSDIHRFDARWYQLTLHLFGLTHIFEFGVKQLIALGVIAVFAAINCLGVMMGGRRLRLQRDRRLDQPACVRGRRQRRPHRLRRRDVRRALGLQRLAVPPHG